MTQQPSIGDRPVEGGGTPGFRMIRTLGLIAMLSGLLVVLVYQFTKPIIADNQRRAVEAAVFEVVPGASGKLNLRIDAAGVTPEAAGGAGELVYAAHDADGALLGVAVLAAAQGYQDVIRLLVGFDPGCECVRGFKVMRMTETPGLGDKIATDPAFLANFAPLDATVAPGGEGLANAIVTVKAGSKQQPWEIDAISGATVSSVAVGKAMNQALQRLAPLIVAHRAAIAEAVRSAAAGQAAPKAAP